MDLFGVNSEHNILPFEGTVNYFGSVLTPKLADLPEDATYVYLNAQLQAMGLYSKFGFVSEGPQFEEAGIQHFKMVLKS